MESRKTAISARIDHELIDYLRINKIPVNTAINAALHYFVKVCQRDRWAFYAAVNKLSCDDNLTSYAKAECRRQNKHYCPLERPIVRDIVNTFDAEK